LGLDFLFWTTEHSRRWVSDRGGPASCEKEVAIF
jgi:hypothetical protein